MTKVDLWVPYSAFSLVVVMAANLADDLAVVTDEW